MKEPRSNIVSGVVSLVDTMESVNFIGISEIDIGNNFQTNLRKMMDKKGSNSFKKKHLQRITKKITQKWSETDIIDFIQSKN